MQRYRIALRDLGASIIWELGDDLDATNSDGVNVRDTSGNTWLGRISGNVEFATSSGPPMGGKFAKFDGGNSIESHLSLNVQQVAVVAWVNLNTTTAEQAVVSLSENATNSWGLLVDGSSSSLKARAMSNAGESAASIENSGELSVGAWSFLSARFLSSTEREVGINGQVFESDLSAVSVSLGAAKLYVGQSMDAGVAQVAVFDKTMPSRQDLYRLYQIAAA